MKNRRLLIILGILLVLVIAVKIYVSNATRVEEGYAKGFYPPVAAFLRLLLGWVPFSLGDILYGLAGAWIIWKFILVIIAVIKRRVTIQILARGILKLVIIFFVINLSFSILWGINYKRKGIGEQLQLSVGHYNKDDLKDLNQILVQKVNTSKQALLHSGEGYPPSGIVYKQVQDAYNSLDSMYPFLQYHTISIKSSIWGWLGNYTGFTGYYNPFTGEAQVNTSIPKFLLPYTACHEVGHQLGYAKENEANFVGYLAAAASSDTLFHYSVYLDLFIYSNRNLFRTDTAAARVYSKQLIPEVRADLTELKNFYLRHQNPFEPLIRWAYGKYLESNEQPEGMLSYDEVTGYLIAYYKKYGKI